MKVAQQQEDNRTILAEVKTLRTEIHKPQDAVPSILHGKMLNFDNSGSSAVHRETGSSIPTSIPAWGATPRNQSYTTQDPNKIFVTPNNKDPGNPLNNNIFATNSMDLDTG